MLPKSYILDNTYMEEDHSRRARNENVESLGGSSPLCAITISQLIRWVRRNTTKLY